MFFFSLSLSRWSLHMKRLLSSDSINTTFIHRASTRLESSLVKMNSLISCLHSFDCFTKPISESTYYQNYVSFFFKLAHFDYQQFCVIFMPKVYCWRTMIVKQLFNIVYKRPWSWSKSSKKWFKKKPHKR